LQYAYIQQTVDLREHGNILGHNQEFKDEVKVLKMGDSFKIADYECSPWRFGTNGAKGM
jgi:hypothetical protein